MWTFCPPGYYAEPIVPSQYNCCIVNPDCYAEPIAPSQYNCCIVNPVQRKAAASLCVYTCYAER